jgi:hypothetical protein
VPVTLRVQKSKDSQAHHDQTRGVDSPRRRSTRKQLLRRE